MWSDKWLVCHYREERAVTPRGLVDSIENGMRYIHAYAKQIGAGNVVGELVNDGNLMIVSMEIIIPGIDLWPMKMAIIRMPQLETE